MRKGGGGEGPSLCGRCCWCVRISRKKDSRLFLLFKHSVWPDNAFQCRWIESDPVVGSSYVQVCRHHSCRDLAVSAPRGGNHNVSGQLSPPNGCDEPPRPPPPNSPQRSPPASLSLFRR